MIWDSSRPREVEFVPVEGPQFIKVPGSWEGLEARDDRFYRIQGPIEEVQRLEAEAPAGALYDTVVTTDSSVSERVSKVTHADNINETVAEYVSAMNLDPALAKQVTDRVLSAISS